MIDRSSLRPDDRIGRGREVERHSREIGRHEGGGGVWRPQLGAERLCVPLPHLHVLLAEKVDVVKLDRCRLLLGLDELDLHLVRSHREGDRCPAGLRRRRDVVFDLAPGRGFGFRDHRVAVCLDLGDRLANVRHREADVVHRGALGTARRRPVGEEDQDVRELDDFAMVGADRDARSPERVHEELLLFLGVHRVDVMVAVDDRPVLGSQELRRG